MASSRDLQVKMHILTDHYWGESGKDLCGIFVFEIGGKLAGLEVYSVDGMITPAKLPNIEELVELPEPHS